MGSAPTKICAAFTVRSDIFFSSSALPLVIIMVEVLSMRDWR